MRRRVAGPIGFETRANFGFLRAGFHSLGTGALITALVLFVTACGHTAEPRTEAEGPITTSCGIALCEVKPPFASSGSSLPSASGGTQSSWVDATGNLTGLASQCGNLTLMSAPPDQDTVIAGVALQGLWASTNGSSTWARLGQGSGSAQITNRPSSITYDPSNPNVFWESGLYNGGGAYETKDGGVTFTQLGTLTHTDYLSVDLSDPAMRTLLSGRHEASNLYRSTDGGATWVNISSTLPAGIGYTTSPVVVSSQVFLLGTTSAPAAGVFRSSDGGATWARVYSGAISGPALVVNSGATIYWLLANGQGVIKSSDKGLTWQRTVGPGVVGLASTSLIELPDGRLATLGATVIVSADGGVSWLPVGPTLPYVPTGLIYAPIRKAFYIWQFDCMGSGPDPVKAGAIMRWVYDYKMT